MQKWYCALALAAVVFTSCQNKEPKQEKMVDVETAVTVDNTDLKIAELTGALEHTPRNPELYRRRALLYFEQKEYKPALEDINKAISLDSANGEFAFQKARFLRSSGKVSEAFKSVNQAIAKDYRNEEVYLLLGELYFIVKEYQKGIDNLNQALKHSPFSERAYYYKGMIYAETGDTSRAISNFQTSVEQTPDFTDGYSQLVKIYLAQKDYEMAQQYAEAGIRFAPTDPFLWYNHALTLQNRFHPDSAIVSYKRALFYDSSMHLANYNLGIIYFYKQDYAAAVPYLEQVLQHNKSLPQTRELLAQAYEQTGQYKNARNIYEYLLQQDPNNALAKVGLQRLRNKPDVAVADTAKN